MGEDRNADANETATEEPQAPADNAGAQAEQEAPPAEAASPEQLRLMLVDARNKADEHWNMLMRGRAEMDNLRKRHERELENAHRFALDRFIAELLPVRDSLELGLNAAREDNADVAKLREGKELTLKLLADAMGKFGIEEIDPLDQPFNPDLHQAISMLPRDDVAANTVVAVVQKGYTLNGRLVRPAMVIVSQAAVGKLDEKT